MQAIFGIVNGIQGHKDFDINQEHQLVGKRCTINGIYPRKAVSSLIVKY
jgi:hypothetical protein